MSQHIERPGSGVLFWEPESERRSDKSPHYKGFVLLDRAYEKGEKIKLAAWMRETSRGTTLISVLEDINYKDYKDDRKNLESERVARKNEPKEVKRGYAAKPRQQGDFDDEDVPF